MIDTGRQSELSLPQPPGFVRLFFARYPWIINSTIVLLCCLPAASYHVGQLFFSDRSRLFLLPEAVALVGVLGGSFALVFRRRHPVWVAVAVAVCSVAVFPAELEQGFYPLPMLFVVYAVAVYHSVRFAWLVFAVFSGQILLFGWILALTRDWTPFTAAFIVCVLLLVATLMGVNVGNRKRYVGALVDRAAQLVRERDQQALLAAASERARIAREMHDIVAHSLTVMVRLADGSELSAQKHPDRARVMMHEVAETGRQALNDMRMVLGVLGENSTHPAQAELSWQPQPGYAELQPLIQSYRAAGLPVVLEITGETPQEKLIQLTVYRVIQEALTNALRYAAHATRVDVKLQTQQEQLLVRITDDGRTGSPAQQEISLGSGRGIIGMRERVAAHNGWVDVGPQSSGWQVQVCIPLAAEPLSGGVL